eukprot:jgi/Bigna1/54932/estExt_Genewise1Plus.C_460038
MQWPSRVARLLERLRMRIPIIQAPMVGASDSSMAMAVGKAGGLGSLPCATISVTNARDEINKIRSGQRENQPLNLNFFSHKPEVCTIEHHQQWLSALDRYYKNLEAILPDLESVPKRAPFGDEMCLLVEEMRPEVVSFHFGLPSPPLLDRVKNAGSFLLGCATTVQEARWLHANGVDGIIAQGYEAGGHRGNFLTQDLAAQPGTLALVPQCVDAVGDEIPVIAAGGIADGRGIAAAIMLGASAVQIGTSYLFSKESTVSSVHMAELRQASDSCTVLTNIFSGKPARGIACRLVQEMGAISGAVPPYPDAGVALKQLQNRAEQQGRADFSMMWCGQVGNRNEQRLFVVRKRGFRDLTLFG